MKKNEKLHKRFNEAVDYVNSYKEPLPADTLLKLYAYYKIANENKNHPGSKTPLINAFKANALIQAKDLAPKAAMSAYIKMVKSLKQPK